MLASRLQDDLKLLDSFLAYVKAHNVPFDIFSYHNYDSPTEQLHVAEAVRQRLDAAGFVSVLLWNSEWNMWEANIPAAIRSNELLHSAYIAAHNAQTKTLLQDLWSEAIIYRANRPANQGTGPTPYEDMYFSSDGTPKPAYFGWLIFKQMADETPQRLQATSSTETGSTVLAGKSADSSRMNVLVTVWSSQSETYRLLVTGFVPNARYTFERYVVDQATTALVPLESGEIVSDASGEAVLAGSPASYSLEFWKLRSSAMLLRHPRRRPPRAY